MPSLTRERMSFTTSAGPRWHSNSQAWVPRDSRPYLTSSDSKAPLTCSRSQYLYPQEQGGPYIPQALGSLFFISDLQSYNGGFQTSLHTGQISPIQTSCLKCLSMDLTENAIPLLCLHLLPWKPLLSNGCCILAQQWVHMPQYLICQTP
jgi:hypothetical protein